MKVLNLQCSHQHDFEGWFASDDDYMDQNGRGLVGHGNLPEMSNFLTFFVGGSALPLSS